MKVNPVGQRCSEVKMAYAAGFLDADGAIMATIEKHQEKKFGFRVRLTVKVTQNSRKILEWYMRTFRVGSIRVNRTTFDWQIRDQKAVIVFLKKILPYLKTKKRQARYALKIFERPVNSFRGFKRVAVLADALSRHNVRSNGRRKNFAAMIQEHCSRND